MTPKTKARLAKWAIAYWEVNPNLTRSPSRSLTMSMQLAIAIYHEIPADGTYIKAEAIADKLDRNKRQVAEILGLIREPWHLKTSKNNKEGGYSRGI